MHHDKRVLVTGAGGTVGGFVVGHLLQEGYKVSATDLSFNQMMEDHYDYWCACAVKYEKFGSHLNPLELVEGDLTNPNFVKNLFEERNIDAVIHCAALIDVAMPYEALEPLNVTATLNLYRKLAKAGGKVFVFLSSGSIYGSAPLLTEKTAIEPSSSYEQSKVDAERLLHREYCDNFLIPGVVFLRPSLIYGPKNKFLAANYLASAVIFAELLGGRLPKFFSGPKTNFVHAEDVARAAIFLMEAELPWWKRGNYIFNICDDSPLGFGDQLRIIARVCGYESLPVRLPIPSGQFLGLFHRVYESPVFLGALNAVLRTVWKLITKKYGLAQGFTPNISKAMTPFFGQDTIFSNEKIKSLGFKLLHPDFEQGIKDVVPWYKTHRWIP